MRTGKPVFYILVVIIIFCGDGAASVLQSYEHALRATLSILSP